MSNPLTARKRLINRRLARRGSSLVVSIPREAVERLKLKDGDSVNVEVGSDSVIIRPMKLRKKWTESEVLEGVTPEMVKGEICWGGPAGKEVL